MTYRVPSSYTAAELSDPTIRSTISPTVLKQPARKPAPPPQNRPLPGTRGSPEWNRGHGVPLGFFAMLSFISVFMPVGVVMRSGELVNITYFSGISSDPTREQAWSAVFDGALILVAMLAVMVFAGIWIVIRKAWVRLTAGGIGVSAAILGTSEGFGAVRSFSKIGYLSGEVNYHDVRIGAVLLGISSTILLIYGIVALLPIRKDRA